ncbi:MAG: hypothetical protein NT151_09505 [Acidobacteria bacterium]|nr:hypothetical protein [Acidobacteriota bacterium]
MPGLVSQEQQATPRAWRRTLPEPTVPAPYHPTPKDWAILDAWLTLRAERKPPTTRNIGHLAGLSHVQVGWRFRRPEWRAWWLEQVHHVIGVKWAEAMAAHIIRAADDLETFRVLLPVMESTGAASAQSPGAHATNNGIVVNIHD